MRLFILILCIATICSCATKKEIFYLQDLPSEINNLLESQIRNVSHIFHLAASSHVDRSVTDPMTFIYDNVVATGNLLNYANPDKTCHKLKFR